MGFRPFTATAQSPTLHEDEAIPVDARLIWTSGSCRWTRQATVLDFCAVDQRRLPWHRARDPSRRGHGRPGWKRPRYPTGSDSCDVTYSALASCSRHQHEKGEGLQPGRASRFQRRFDLAYRSAKHALEHGDLGGFHTARAETGDASPHPRPICRPPGARSATAASTTSTPCAG